MYLILQSTLQMSYHQLIHKMEVAVYKPNYIISRYSDFG